MKTAKYTYCVIRYSPDAGAGEMLNVGVVLQGAEHGELHWQLEERYERLSAAFAGFSGKPYRAGLACLSEALEAMRDTARHTLLSQPDKPAASARAVLARAIPDPSLGFNISEPRGGVSSNLATEVRILFERMVASRRPSKPESAYRSNDQVWKDVYEPRIPPDVRARLREKTIETPSVEVRFDHAFKNGSWHCVQPLSLDYKTAETISKHASEWAGKAVGLNRSSEKLRIYFLVGEPRDVKLRPNYEKALRLLAEAPVEHQIVEESKAADFADQLAEIVRHA